MLKVLIADDDPFIRIILQRTLAQIPDVEVVAEVENGEQLIETTTALLPDVVFVDIDMPGINGLDAARRIFDISQDIFIVFATGYDGYTREAFEIYAFDYLVKPFNLERINQTVERIKKTKGARSPIAPQDSYPASPDKEDLKVCVGSYNRQHYINSSDIILITRLARKTIIYTEQGSLEVKETLRDLSQKLRGGRFFRCHKGYIINVDMVAEVMLFGDKTYLVKFVNLKETALMTYEKAREFRTKYGRPTTPA